MLLFRLELLGDGLHVDCASRDGFCLCGCRQGEEFVVSCQRDHRKVVEVAACSRKILYAHRLIVRVLGERQSTQVDGQVGGLCRYAFVLLAKSELEPVIYLDVVSKHAWTAVHGLWYV